MTNIFIEYLKEYIKDTKESLLGFCSFEKESKQHKTSAHNNHVEKPTTPRHIVHIPKEAMDLCNKMQAEGRPVKNDKKSDK